MSSTVLIRSLEQSTKARLKAQADASNRSLEAYLREIVTRAAETAPQVQISEKEVRARRRPPTLPGKVIEHGDVFSSEPEALWEQGMEPRA